MSPIYSNPKPPEGQPPLPSGGHSFHDLAQTVRDLSARANRISTTLRSVGQLQYRLHAAAGEELSQPTLAPDTISPYLGYRAWMVFPEQGRGRPWLHSIHHPAAWLPGRPLTAECGGGRVHEAPSRYCACGIYATLRLGEAINYARQPGRAVLGVVAGWGRVMAGPNGWRAQHAYPVALLDDRMALRHGAWHPAFGYDYEAMWYEWPPGFVSVAAEEYRLPVLDRVRPGMEDYRDLVPEALPAPSPPSSPSPTERSRP